MKSGSGTAFVNSTSTLQLIRREEYSKLYLCNKKKFTFMCICWFIIWI